MAALTMNPRDEAKRSVRITLPWTSATSKEVKVTVSGLRSDGLKEKEREKELERSDYLAAASWKGF